MTRGEVVIKEFAKKSFKDNRILDPWPALSPHDCCTPLAVTEHCLQDFVVAVMQTARTDIA